MEIFLSKSAGFCMGVRRAIDTAKRVADETNGDVFTYGPLIHNPQELERLEKEGIHSLSETDPLPEGPLVVRAHGVPPKVMDSLASSTLRLVDATCPKVSSIQKRIEKHSAKGYAIVISGDPKHPEVVGLVGHAKGEVHVISSIEGIDALPELGKAVLVSQTTTDEYKYELIKKRFLERFPEGEALSTICSSTHLRQSELREMAHDVEAVVVIGGRNSSNTMRLVEIAKGLGLVAYHVETVDELPLDKLGDLSRVGVSAGASTPEWIIQQVVEKLESL